ncbi:hypothetical protein LCGC14_3019590, partial [marine sediment metagenome]
KPVQIHLSAHDGGETISWSGIQKSGTHPVAYAAWGSHALYSTSGDHTYESSKRDIELSLEKINPGGTICGHDADWDGVKKAVKESLPGAINIPGTKLWAWSKA